MPVVFSGSGIINVGAPTPPPPPSSFKFHPGWYCVTDSQPADQTNCKAEIDLLATSGSIVGGLWTGSPFIGYGCNANWYNCETAFNTYDFSFFTILFNYLQTKCPGARFAASIFSWQIGHGLTPGAGVQFTSVPNYILNDSTYGSLPGNLPGPNGFQYGYQLCNPNGDGTWAIVAPCFQRPTVVARIKALWQNFASTSFLTTAGPYAGQTFTFDTHPLFEMGLDQGELSLDMVSNSGGTPAPTPPDYSRGAFDTGYFSYISAVPSYWPHTVWAPMAASYGQSPGGNAANAEVQGAVQALANNGGMISNADTYPLASQLTTGQLIYIGQPIAGVSPTTDYRGRLGYVGYVQPPDYGYTSPLDTCIADIRDTTMNTTLRCPYGLWAIWDDGNSGISQTVFFNSHLVPALRAASIINTTKPSNLPN